MTRTEMVAQVKFLEKQRDAATNDEDKRNFQIQIDHLNEEIGKIDRSCDGRTTAQNVVGGITRLGAGLVSFVVGEVDACTTGRTDEEQVKRRRGKFVDNAEAKAVGLTKTIENLINRRK